MKAISPVTTLASFEVHSSTPMLLGGYDGCACHGSNDCEPLRSQSLKGVLRWWSRAALAGALYSRGVNGRELIKRVLEASGNLWGSTNHVSPMILRTYGSITRYSCSSISGHSRYRLISLGHPCRRGSLCGWLRSGEVYLNVPTWENLPTSHIEHAVLSLIVLFHLGGLGKGSRRGLGSLDIRRWNNVDPSYIDPSNISSTLRRLSAASSAIISRYPARGDRGGLPSIPAIAEDVFRLFRCKIKNPVRAAIEFSRAVLRPQLSIRHGAWILGLPRRGYKAGVSRRASPIMFSAHRGVGFISAFYSSDWPNRIRHGNYRISVTDEEIKRHMDAALDYIVGRLNRYGIECREVKVW